MNVRTPALAILLVVITAACDGLVDLQPVDRLTDETAIADARGARAALTGAYAALQSGSYYGGDFLFFNDLSADNAIHTGTFNNYFDAARNELRADNTFVAGMWNAMYDGINRTNHIIQRVPELEDLTPEERDLIVGQAHFLRALHYHNLVRLWDGVPIRTQPIEGVTEASQIARSTVNEVYDQIMSDLDAARSMVTTGTDTRRATPGAVEALLARVHLYRENWPAAEAAAGAVEAMGYTLAPDFDDLHTGDGQDTVEDIFRVLFTLEQWQYLGFYYITPQLGGRGELSAQQALVDAFEPGDLRRDLTVQPGEGDTGYYGVRFPTTNGAEHPHVVRFAEVILTKAEALAQQGRLAEAVDEYNRVRVRADLPEHELDTDVSGQQEVLEAIWHERRLELALEGDRFSDLRRSGRTEQVLEIPEYQTRFPIPQREIDVAPNMTQNPGY